MFVDPFIEVSYEEAEYFCQQYNGQLMMIQDLATFKDIIKYIKDNRKFL